MVSITFPQMQCFTVCFIPPCLRWQTGILAASRNSSTTSHISTTLLYIVLDVLPEGGGNITDVSAGCFSREIIPNGEAKKVLADVNRAASTCSCRTMGATQMSRLQIESKAVKDSRKDLLATREQTGFVSDDCFLLHVLLHSGRPLESSRMHLGVSSALMTMRR